MLNLGGIKLACADIEDAIRAMSGVADAGATDLGGVLTLGVAVVDGADVSAVLAEVRRNVAFPVRAVGVAQVPRTPLGKIRRRELRALLQSDG